MKRCVLCNIAFFPEGDEGMCPYCKEERDRKSPDDTMARCPSCGSTDLSGLMEAFWVPLGEDGEPDGEWVDWESSTEVGDKRLCGRCQTEFEI